MRRRHDRRPVRAGRRRRDRRARAHDRRQPDHAPPVPWTGSDRAGGRRSPSRPTRPCIVVLLELDLTTTNAGARVYVLPCIAGHVGADTAGVILSEAPHDQAVVTSSSTSARTRRSCSATATVLAVQASPAFEGAQISCGRARRRGDRARPHRSPDPGASVPGDRRRSVERRGGLRRDHRDRVAGGIIEAIAELFLAGVVTTDGAIDGSLADPERTHRGRRADVLLRCTMCRGPASRDHAERRAADPAREGGPVRRVSTP